MLKVIWPKCKSKSKLINVVFSICGAHLDGYPANAATTVIVGSGAAEGPQADVLLGAWTAFQAAQRVFKEAATNT